MPLVGLVPVKFYLGTHNPAWLGRYAVSMFPTRSKMPKRKFPRALAPWVMDSGGFTEVTKRGGWKTPPRDFAAQVRLYVDEIGMMDWAAPQDWMCESVALKATGLDVAKHIRLTIDNYLELRQIAPDLPFVPVLQGFALDDYRRCADLYADAGVDLAAEKIVGLGSVCRRQGTEEAVGIVLGVLRHAPGIRLHGFGFKKDGLDLAHSSLASADSLAWSRQGRYQTVPDHPHPRPTKNCANCPTFAFEWLADLLKRTPRAVQQPLF